MRKSLLLLVCLGLCGATQAQSVSSELKPKARPARAFADWLVDFRKEARAENVSKVTLDKALAGIQYKTRIIELDRKQPENTITHAQYLQRTVPKSRITKGRRKLAENKALLQEISTKYGVQPRFIVALWGIETDFGGNTGGFYVPEALATLAYDGRRSAYFRGELLNALKVIDGGHIAARAMKGSWAGAMGQTQFMPSSFLKYAVDYDGDGRKDIWNTKADIFASIANYLSQSGWDDTYTWGRAVMLPKGFDAGLVEDKTRKNLADWQVMGVRKANNTNLPDAPLAARVVTPGKTAYLVYGNYDVLMKWNRSNYFATAVGTLSNALN